MVNRKLALKVQGMPIPSFFGKIFAGLSQKLYFRDQ